MSFLRRLVPGYPGRGDGDGEEGEGEALLEHEDYSSSESESSSGSESAIENDYMNGMAEEDESSGAQMEEDSSSGRELLSEDSSQSRSSSSSGGGGSASGRGMVSEGKQKKQKKKFDISLPAQHLYLGELEEEGVAGLEEDEATPTLPLLCIPNRVLFPEETLPMHIYNPHVIQVLRDAITRKKPVAIATDLRLRARYAEHLTRRPTKEELAEFGTTAEVVGLREEEQSNWFYAPYLIVKLHGKQRFRLMEVYRRVNGTMDARIEILPEKLLPHRPYELFTCPAHVYDGCHATQLLARQPDCSEEIIKRLEVCRRRLQSPHLSSSLCSTPSWVFTFYDTDYLREILMREQQMKTFIQEKVSSLPEDIQSLSYWLARRLPIDDQSKLQLLSIHCPTQRLIRGLQILKEFTDLSCENCDTIITKKEHVFSMSVDGPLASYVNPGGYVHDTLTVVKADHLRKQGRATTEHSWFPGYKWTIMNCKSCGEHKGWLFEATKKKMEPEKFYGLRRPALQLKTSSPPPPVNSLK